MFRRIVLGTIALVSSTALIVQAAPKDDIQAAAQKLADSANYSWTSTSANAGGGRGFGGGTQTGKTQKDGLTTLSLSMRDTSYEVVKQGDKIAVKTDAGWQTAAEAGGGDAGGGFNPNMFVVMQAQNIKLPAAQVQEIVSKLDAVTPADDAMTATLSEDQVKGLMAFRFPRPAGAAAADAPAPPTIADGKGTVKFWIKDGVLSKYELHLTGTMSFGGNDNPVDRTTTVEIKDVGTTTIDVPAEAKAKLG